MKNTRLQGFENKKNKYSNYLIIEYAKSIIDLGLQKRNISEDGWGILNSCIPFLKRSKLIAQMVEKIKKQICQENLNKYYDDNKEERMDGTLKYFVSGQKRSVPILFDDYKKILRHLPCLHHFFNHAGNIFSVDNEMKVSFWEALRKLLNQEQNKIKNIEKDFLFERFEQISQFFQLNDVERKILEFIFQVEVSSILADFLTNFTGSTIISYTQFISRFLNIPIKKFRHALRSKGRLVKMGIIEIYDSEIKINRGILNFLSGMGDNTLLENFFRKDELQDLIPLSSLNIDKQTIEVLKNLINKGKSINILFYGAPGAGKTSLARSLSHELNRNLYFINELNQNNKEDSNGRKIYLRTANEILDPKKDIIVIDECDQIIQTVNSWTNFGTVVDKSWINQFLTENRVPMIWISNSINNMEESTRRRFSFSIKFNPKTEEELKNIWINQVKKLEIKVLSNDDISYLVKKFNVSPGAIELASKNLNLSRKNLSREKVLSQLDIILNAHQELIDKKKSSFLNEITPFYDLKYLTSDVNLFDMIETLRSFEKNKNHLNSMIPNQNILLSGPPGVGKSELCKYIAKELEKPLILKRASDLLSKFVGESEQQIAEAFKEASDSGSILFIDEVDSLLQDRSNAHRSWEVSQVNEILTWLENHKTICLMATNYLHKTDSALLRRMNFKIKLGYLESDGVEFFYKKIFSELSSIDLSSEQISEIKKFSNLTPGDLKAVYQRIALSKNIPHSQIIEELRLESNYKKSQGMNCRKIGL
jgi:SpoVK/Ycf46/Vps4 family AAA+-type ATPase